MIAHLEAYKGGGVGGGGGGVGGRGRVYARYCPFLFLFLADVTAVVVGGLNFVMSVDC